MNNTKKIAQQLLQIPINVEYLQNFSNKQKVAGLFLLSFFMLLGIGIISGGLKAEENGIYYIIFGIVFCAFPFILYLIITNSKKKSITLLDKDGVILKNNKMYSWENLRKITYHTSLYEQNENERYFSIEFKFTNGNAFATYEATNFSYILQFAEKLPVPKNEFAVARYK